MRRTRDYLRSLRIFYTGAKRVPVKQRPLPSWPKPVDPWASSAETIVIPRSEVNR